jgi:predicted small lipoprotein YifL
MARYPCRKVILLLTVLLLPALGGCGQKGDLYLPDESKRTEARDKQQP